MEDLSFGTNSKTGQEWRCKSLTGLQGARPTILEEDHASNYQLRVSHHRLLKIASCHHLPRIVLHRPLKNSLSEEPPVHKYIASRDQREWEQEIYEVRPATLQKKECSIHKKR